MPTIVYTEQDIIELITNKFLQDNPFLSAKDTTVEFFINEGLTLEAELCWEDNIVNNEVNIDVGHGC